MPPSEYVSVHAANAIFSPLQFSDANRSSSELASPGVDSTTASVRASPESWPRWSSTGYSISWSARTSTDGGIVSRRPWAVFTLMTRSNRTGCSTGRSPGFAPFRILSTTVAARRQSSGRFGPRPSVHPPRQRSSIQRSSGGDVSLQPRRSESSIR
jgi:hypothetical protein